MTDIVVIVIGVAVIAGIGYAIYASLDKANPPAPPPPSPPPPQPPPPPDGWPGDPPASGGHA